MGTSVLHGAAAVRATRDALAPLLDDLPRSDLRNGLPFVVVGNLEELAVELRRLHADPAALDAMQAETRAWWVAAKAHYSRQFEQALCTSVK